MKADQWAGLKAGWRAVRTACWTADKSAWSWVGWKVDWMVCQRAGLWGESLVAKKACSKVGQMAASMVEHWASQTADQRASQTVDQRATQMADRSVENLACQMAAQTDESTAVMMVVRLVAESLSDSKLPAQQAPPQKLIEYPTSHTPV